MQEPAFRPRAALAINPGERALAGARDEVVALCFGAVPPACLDALRTSEQREVAFREAARRLDQPQRARGGAAAGLFLPGQARSLGGDERDRPLRAMIFARIQLLH